MVVSVLASHTDDPGSSPGSGAGSLPSGATDEAPGQVVSLVKGSPMGDSVPLLTKKSTEVA